MKSWGAVGEEVAAVDKGVGCGCMLGGNRLVGAESCYSIHAYLEHGAQASDLLLGHASSNDLERLLLQLVHGGKATHALQNYVVQRSLTGRTVLTHPVMLQNGVGIGPLLGILYSIQNTVTVT